MNILPGDQGVDFAYRAPTRTGQALASAGFLYVIRYICDSTANPKHITLAERDEILASGLGLLVVWESQSIRPFSGLVGGLQDGLTARARLTWLGYPPDVPVLLAFDTDITKPTLAVAEAYGRAFIKTVGWPVIPYGDTDIGDALSDVSRGTWLPNASAWSRLLTWITGGNLHVVMRQGKSTAAGWDTNVCVRPLTAWSAPHPSDGPVEPPVIIPTLPNPNQTRPSPVWPAAYTPGDDEMGYIAGDVDDHGTARFYVTGVEKRHIFNEAEVERLKRRKLLRPDFNLSDPNDPDLEWMTTEELNTYPTV